MSADPIRQVVDALNEGRPEGRIFKLSAPRTVTIQQADGSYRKKPLAGGEEFFLKEVRVGKRAAMIVAFEPVDAMPFLQAEFSDSDAADAMSGFTDWAEGVLGMSVAKAKSSFAKQAKAEKALKTNEEKKALTERYENDGAWGTW